MSALNNDLADEIKAAVNILKSGPDTEEIREVVRAAIEGKLKNTKLEHYRVSEVLIPLPTSVVNGSSPSHGDGGNGGATAVSALPPIDDDAVEFVDGIIRTSSDSALSDAEDLWVITYDPR